MVKNLPAIRETWVQSLGQEDPLEKEMATHSSILAWRISQIAEPRGLQSMGLQRVRHDWLTLLLFSNSSEMDFSIRLKQIWVLAWLSINFVTMCKLFKLFMAQFLHPHNRNDTSSCPCQPGFSARNREHCKYFKWKRIQYRKLGAYRNPWKDWRRKFLPGPPRVMPRKKKKKEVELTVLLPWLEMWRNLRPCLKYHGRYHSGFRKPPAPLLDWPDH